MEFSDYFLSFFAQDLDQKVEFFLDNKIVEDLEEAKELSKKFARFVTMIERRFTIKEMVENQQYEFNVDHLQNVITDDIRWAEALRIARNSKK